MHKRDISVDALRGLAIFLMVAAHTAAFLNNSNVFWKFMQETGNTVCYTMFIFVFGISSYFSIFSKEYDTNLRNKILRNVLKLLAAYYILAFFGILESIRSKELNFLLIFKVLTFIVVPTFSEFLIPFIFYTLIFLIIKKYNLDEILKEKFALLYLSFLGSVTFIAGSVLYLSTQNLSSSNSFTLIIGFLSGFNGLYRFPLLQYFICPLLGIYFGKNLFSVFKNNGISITKKFDNTLILSFLFLSTISIIIFPLKTVLMNKLFADFNRWPPSLLFITATLALTLISFIFIRKNNYIQRLLSTIGIYALPIVVVHIAILRIVSLLKLTKTSNFLILCIWFIMLLFSFRIAQFVLIKIKDFISARMNFKQSQYLTQSNKHIRHKESRHYAKSLMFTLLLLITTASVFIYLFFNNPKALSVFSNNFRGSNTNNTLTDLLEKRNETWWNNDYRFNSKISIRNDSNYKSLDSKEIVVININHAKLVKENKSFADARDLEVVYLDRNNSYQKTEYEIINPNTENAKLKFRLIDPISTQKVDDYYYLYYGNVLGDNKTSTIKGDSRVTDNSNYFTSFIKDNEHPFSVNLSRKWIIKTGDDVDSKYHITNITAKYSSQDEVKLAKVEVTDKNNLNIKSIEMKSLDKNEFTQSIDISNEKAAEYYINISALENGQKITSPKQRIYVSSPLYVNWSLDWEGFTVEDKWLTMIDNIAKTNNVPLTHYFNPRIYVSTLPQDQVQAKKLTQWVKNRAATNGDEIQLHLHMWYDMVKAVGIEPKTEPSWEEGDKGGHDVAATAYSPEEFEKMIIWGKEQFAKNNLPVPIGYRAGGWQINAEQLKVLSKNGFEFDSSGREAVNFGSKKLPVPWNLYPTTKPYHPSIYDINTPGETNVGLWEFPINGNSSSNSGPNSNKVTENFKANYTGGVLKDKQTLCVLSHVQYFQIDEGVMKRFFAETSKYEAEKDEGPVIYKTIEKILPEYETKD